MSKLQVDFQKIDPLLTSQLSMLPEGTLGLFGVFVRTTGPLSTPDVEAKLNADPRQKIRTGDLNSEEIAMLSNDPAVSLITGAATCRPL